MRYRIHNRGRVPSSAIVRVTHMANLRRLIIWLMMIFAVFTVQTEPAATQTNLPTIADIFGEVDSASTSIAWADWDNDGDMDLAVGNYGQPNRIYENDNGVLAFDPTGDLGWVSDDDSQTTSIAWADMEWDGDPDLAVGNQDQPNQVFRNDDGVLTLIWQSDEASDTTSIAWGDWRGLGNLDLAIGNDSQPVQIYENNGDTFNLAVEFSEIEPTTSIAWADWNRDGNADLAVGNDGSPNRIYQSEGDDFFIAWEDNESQNTTSVAWGDWNVDGHLDLAVGNLGQPNRVYQNDVGDMSLAWEAPNADDTTSVIWADWNDDGRRDLVVGNMGQANQIFENDGLDLTAVWVSKDAANTTAIAWGHRQNESIALATANRDEANHLYSPQLIRSFPSFQILVDDDVIHEEEWKPQPLCAPGRCGGGKEQKSHIFEAPNGATSVEIEVFWVWQGNFPGQEQNVESFRVDTAGRGAECLDVGNGETIDRYNCWNDRFNRSTDLEVTLTHLFTGGRPETAESISSEVIVRWFAEAKPEPPTCQSVTLSQQPTVTIPFTGTEIDVTVNGENGTQYRILQLGSQGIGGNTLIGPQASNQFSSLNILPNITYQAQVGNDNGDWSTNGCEFSFPLEESTPPTATAECTGGSVTNPNDFPIDIDFRIDGQTIFNGPVPANSTLPINYAITDFDIHIAELSWVGGGDSGRLDLGSFGPCGIVIPPTATSSCDGGSVTNPNSIPIQITYRVDNDVVFLGEVAANDTRNIDFTYNDIAIHNAQVAWSSNNENGIIDAGSFGPCEIIQFVMATAACDGGSITNPNPFPIQASYTLDNNVLFDGQVDANTTVLVPYSFDDDDIDTHEAVIVWSDDGLEETTEVLTFGPCGAIPPVAMAGCTGGSITNSNPFPIAVTFTLDNQDVVYQGNVPASDTLFIDYIRSDGQSHTATITWSGNTQSGTLGPFGFGPCTAIPDGTSSCTGGTIINPNAFSLLAIYFVDGVEIWQGVVPANDRINIDYAYSDQMVHTASFTWSGNNESGTVILDMFGPCDTIIAAEPTGTAGCGGGTIVNPNPFPIMVTYTVDGNVKFEGIVPAETTISVEYSFSNSDKHTAQFTWSGNGGSGTVNLGSFGPCSGGGQFQGFIGPVAFGQPPLLEPGKEYFDGTRSIMYNVEHVRPDGYGEIVFRVNGRELSDITHSLFNSETFRQTDSTEGRAITTLDNGPTKLIAYRFGVERARVFQSMAETANRWIHPLDQPFEHKPAFSIQLYGPPGQTDLLIYQDQEQLVQYGADGTAEINLSYTSPGLVAVYTRDGVTNDIDWLTTASVTFPISQTELVNYDFTETDLYHYRMLDAAGNIIDTAQSGARVTFEAEPSRTYYAQLAYPATSLYVAVHDDMQFQHPNYWRTPVNAAQEHLFEFHVDYHRLDDPNLGNDHIRGDVVIEALYLINATTSVAQQFPYSRHDGALPGITLIGIPDVSMVAFCVRPGVHEVVFWGGWENESYHLVDRSQIYDQTLYDDWSDEQRNDCLDAARRINMRLAHEGLRTEHTHRHHGEASQGYQLVQHNAWSPYNLADMRPPHVGKIIKRGVVLDYYEEPADLLFWGWDLTSQGLADGVDATALQQRHAILGPVEYVDQTGLHPPERLNR